MNNLAFTNIRRFGGKGPPAKGGGGPPGAAATYVEPAVPKSNFQGMIEAGGTDQFLFGPPPGVEKIHNAHRDRIYPKLAAGAEFYAKKMRQQYIREGTYPDVKIYLDPIRYR